jgi:hypothetical protein
MGIRGARGFAQTARTVGGTTGVRKMTDDNVTNLDDFRATTLPGMRETAGDTSQEKGVSPFDPIEAESPAVINQEPDALELEQMLVQFWNLADRIYADVHTSKACTQVLWDNLDKTTDAKAKIGSAILWASSHHNRLKD